MTLSPEQKQAVVSWVAAGDNLSAVQKKLSEQFQISLTYRDVRFLVDDLDLALKDPAPKVDTSDVSKTQPAPASAAGKPKGNPGPGGDASLEAAEPDEDDVDINPPAPDAGGVTVTVDKLNLIPGAVASGTVTFSDGVTGKWIVDNQGSPGFTEISQPGYRPSPSDGQAFMQALTLQLQQRGF
jgi:hypothetical protein